MHANGKANRRLHGPLGCGGVGCCPSLQGSGLKILLRRGVLLTVVSLLRQVIRLAIACIVATKPS